ncbi:hypothetical protein B566_EDAN009384 [Ephemera danica]|nr:hypothetical protein B566_EDAN009384 [Ephemera danica]
MVLYCMEYFILGFLLGLPFLYETSRQFRYYLKFSLYYVIVMATALLVIPFMIFRPGEVRNLLLASSLCRHISTLLGLRWELRGREHLEKERACVIIKLWIFPEGTRSNGSMLPFKKGAFHVAVSAQLPILPAVFSSYYFLDHASKTLDQGRVIMTFLPPVETKGLCHEDIESLMEKTRSDMITEFHRSSAEVLATLQPKSPVDCNQ